MPSRLLSSLSPQPCPPYPPTPSPGPWCPDGHSGLPPSLGPGPNAFLVIIKGCTLERDHDVQVTQHRAGPGLSIVSYTYVCREKDLCNDLFTTLPVWTPSSYEGVRGGGRKKGLRRAERACSLRIPPSHLDWPHSPGLRLPPNAAPFDSPGAAVCLLC